MAIIATLLSIAVPRYFDSVQRAKENVLKENLALIRDSLQKYYSDRGRYPEKLDDLEKARYLRKLPVDPITGSAATWIAVPTVEPEPAGVMDVQSGAPGKSIDGVAFREW